MNKKLLTTVVGAALAVAGGTANAIDLKISGGVARAVMWADDGVDSQTYHADPTTWPSRIRFLASDDLVAGVKAGVNWESGYNSNRTSTVSQLDHSDPNTTGTANNPPLSERWQEIWFSGAFGKLSFGQGNSASKDGHGSDLSNTDLFNGGNPADFGGTMQFRNASTGALSGAALEVQDVINTFEGNRHDRIRYDSPALGPVTVSASTGYFNNADMNDFAVRMNQDFGSAGKVAAAVYYASIKRTTGSNVTLDSDGGNTEHTGFSASWLSPMGLNVTVAFAKKESEHATDPFDAEFKRVKVGYIVGEHAFSVGYALGEGQVRTVTAIEADHISLAYNWKPKPWADIFAGVAVISLDHPTTEYDDLKIATVGSRITF
ncbi:MAG TPA: porin [Pyrinomonadaceae bacterium]|nr:porin [Pyrinomonadaceae bacterium]